VSAICPIVRGGIDDYLADALPGPQRRILRQHLEDCSECAAAAKAKDPTLLFARRFEEALPAGEGEGILSAVRTGMALMKSERRIARSRVRRRSIGLATAAAAVVAICTFLLWGGSASRPEPEAARAVTPSLPDAVQPAAVPVEADRPSSNATVYDWNPGAGREEPRVVWIVDRGLDI
jgi:predicted anti-sigma-YlaC factor YlaD